MAEKKRVKIVGATGYGGVGMIELLLSHPQLEAGCLVALQDVGKPINEVYPHLDGLIDQMVVAPDSPEAQQAYDLVIFSTPDGVGMRDVRVELERGAQVIDYSGDFRFTSLEAYTDYATRLGRDPEHKSADLLGENVYGLAELHRAELKAQPRLVGNPGCFAASCILGLAPAAKFGMIDPISAICDCKTGVSGAGKKVNAAFHYPARYENMNAYRLSGHQHVCEVEHELSALSAQNYMLTFTAQVVPTCRGILSCLYGTLDSGWDVEKIKEAYASFYGDSPFVRLYDRNDSVGTNQVRGSNFCNLTVDADERTGRLRIVSHIDNLMKGQAGNALQNINLMLGFEETAGLQRPGQYP